MSEIFMWAKKLSLERTSEGGGAIPVVTPVPAYTYYFSTGYCNSQSDISSAQRPAPVRTRHTNCLNPENNVGVRNVPETSPRVTRRRITSAE